MMYVLCVPATSAVCPAAKNVRQHVPGCRNCERVPGSTVVRAGPRKARYSAVPHRVHCRARAWYCKLGICANAALGLWSRGLN